MLDLLLRGAEVHDGDGRPPRRRSVGVQQGRLVLPGADAPPARRTLDLDGLVLAPGFIDPHSHADLLLVGEPSLAGRLLAGRVGQGVTTTLVGNCGMGAAPRTAATEPILRGINGWMTADEVAWPWTDLGGYLRELERRPLPLNVGALQAHGPLRLEAFGAGAGRVDAGGIEVMRRRARAALEAGAFGISAGLIYPPGMYADTDELVALGREAAEFDVPFACHLRGSSELLLPSVKELLSIGRRAGCRVHHSHCEAVGRDHWPKLERVLDLEEEARRQGVRIAHDLFPYHAAATLMAALFPPASLAGGIEALLDRLRDPEARRGLRRDIEETVPAWPPWTAGGWPHNLVRAVGWSNIRVASLSRAGAGGAAPGVDLAELGRRRGCHPFEALADLMLEQRGIVGQLLFGISGEEGDDGPMERLLRDPHGAICTDAEDLGRGLPHPAAYGSFPRVLGRWVRERRTLQLPEAIRRMTSLPAELFGIRDRGRIADGAAADLVAFDPATVRDRAGYLEPRRPPDGVRHVLVNGELVLEDGRYRGGGPGRVLRR